MKTHRWTNPSHPRYLQNSVLFLYLTAAIGLFFGVLGGGVGTAVGLPTLLGVAGGYGIANDKKWGYYLAVVVAVFPLLVVLLYLAQGVTAVLSLNIIFQVILVVMLLDKSSREYVRIWFR